MGNTYSEDQLMNTFMDNYRQGGKYYDKTESHQAELSRGEIFTDQKYLSISSLQTDYLNMEIRSFFGRNSEITNTVKTK